MLLITGMNGALGRALCIEALDRGLPISGVVRNVSAISEVQDLVDRGAKVFVADLSNIGGIKKLLSEISDSQSVPSTLIINAASMKEDFSGGILGDEVNEVVFTNLIGPLLLLGGLLPDIQAKNGRVIGISSLSARLATDQGRIAYPASKAGLSMALSALRLQSSLEGVRFITVEPGLMCNERKLLSTEYSRAARRVINLVQARNPKNRISFPVLSNIIVQILVNIPAKITKWVVLVRSKISD